MKLIYKYLAGSRGLLLASMICVVLSSAIMLISPLIISYCIDELIGGVGSNLTPVFGELLPNLQSVFYLLIGMAIISAIFIFLKGILSNIAVQRIAKNLRDDLYSHIQHFSFETHSENQTGELIQRSTSDVETFLNFIRLQITEIARIIITVAAATILMLGINLKLSIVPLLVAPILLFISTRFRIRVEKVFTQVEEDEAALTGHISESIAGVRVVKAFGMEKYEIDKVKSANSKYFESYNKMIKTLGIFFAGTDILTFLQLGSVYFIGAFMVISGETTLGILVAFSTYTGLMTWPLKQLGKMIAQMGKSTVAIGRIDEILSTPTDTDNATLTPDIVGNIVFDNVSFGYRADNQVLSSISFEIDACKTLGIVGPTGCGKSTLILLLQRLYEYEGSIKIDGVELRDIKKSWIRSKVGLVMQEPHLYSKNIYENIAIAVPSASKHEIESAARMASIHNNILEFKEKYETVVGEKGVSLSGGQKQRIAISRTLIDKSKSILIFDDSLSAVDNNTDLQIRKALKEQSSDRTTIIISHRIASIKDADKILVMVDGKIEDSGKHEELKSSGGLYQRLWEIQTGQNESE